MKKSIGFFILVCLMQSHTAFAFDLSTTTPLTQTESDKFTLFISLAALTISVCALIVAFRKSRKHA